MAKRVRFIAKYDHRWPSGSVTAYKPGWVGLVKDEVAEGAGARAVPADEGDQAKAPEALPDNFMALQKVARDEGIDGSAAGSVAELQALIFDARTAKATLPGNLPADLAQPQALTPNLHVGGDQSNADSTEG